MWPPCLTLCQLSGDLLSLQVIQALHLCLHLPDSLWFHIQPNPSFLSTQQKLPILSSLSPQMTCAQKAPRALAWPTGWTPRGTRLLCDPRAQGCSRLGEGGLAPPSSQLALLAVCYCQLSIMYWSGIWMYLGGTEWGEWRPQRGHLVRFSYISNRHREGYMVMSHKVLFFFTANFFCKNSPLPHAAFTHLIVTCQWMTAFLERTAQKGTWAIQRNEHYWLNLRHLWLCHWEICFHEWRPPSKSKSMTRGQGS